MEDSRSSDSSSSRYRSPASNTIVVRRFDITFVYYRATDSIIVYNHHKIPVDAAPMGDGLRPQDVKHSDIEEWATRWLLWDTDRAIKAAAIDRRREIEAEAGRRESDT